MSKCLGNNRFTNGSNKDKVSGFFGVQGKQEKLIELCKWFYAIMCPVDCNKSAIKWAESS